MKKIISDRRIILIVFITLSLAASVLSLIGTKTYREGGRVYNRYNNYSIFERSFDHLVMNQDLYVAYPEEHWDLYKYTPTFSAFFGIYSILPDWLGLCLWNLTNALILFLAIYYLPKLNLYQKGLISIIVLLELMGSMQNEQSNALIAGLIILAFGFLERNKMLWATLCIVCTAFVKLFGVVGFALFLFYPSKWKSAVYTLGWTLLLAAIPLLFISWDQYIYLFQSFGKMLSYDHDESYGFSVMGIISSWFSMDVNKNLIVGIGAMMFLLPFLRVKLYQEFMFKFLILCSILIWIVIFNHKAESPTFIIAMTGIALWFVYSPKSRTNTVLFIAAFILVSITPTDIFPRYLREVYVEPYALKALPCVLIWVKILYDAIVLKPVE